MKRAVQALFLTVFLLPVTSFADPGHSHNHTGKNSLMHDESMHSKNNTELLKDLTAAMIQIDLAVSEKDAAKLHDLTEFLPHLATHIAENADESAKVRANGSAKNIATLSAKLHTESDKGEFEAAANIAKKLDGMIKLFKGQVE